MKSYKIALHPSAVEEAQAAARWYAERSPAAGESFLVEIDTAIARIGAAPNRYAKYLGKCRRYLFRQFPFALIYRVKEKSIEVVAFAHARRRPGYWSNR